MSSSSPTSRYRAFSALRPGDPVVAVAPASSFDRASFEAGLEIISRRYQVHYDPGLLTRHRYLAGSDERRLAELAAALADTGARAVFCARGGYGMTRLLPGLEGLPLPAKPVIRILRHHGAPPGAATAAARQHSRPRAHPGLPRLDAATHARLFELLKKSAAQASDLTGPGNLRRRHCGGAASRRQSVGPEPASRYALPGTARGRHPPARGRRRARPYRLDRKWTHLAQAGVFRQVRGIVLGEFTGCEEKEADFSSADVLRELATATGLPCAAGFPGRSRRPQPTCTPRRARAFGCGQPAPHVLESAAAWGEPAGRINRSIWRAAVRARPTASAARRQDIPRMTPASARSGSGAKGRA